MKKSLLILLLASSLQAETYKYQPGNASVVRGSDFATIPNDLQNRDWQEFQAWIAQGNTPTTADPPLTDAQISSLIRASGVTALSAKSDYSILQRAVADIIKDEINILRRLQNLPDRNLTQLKTAIVDRINSGNVDK